MARKFKIEPYLSSLYLTLIIKKIQNIISSRSQTNDAIWFKWAFDLLYRNKLMINDAILSCIKSAMLHLRLDKAEIVSIFPTY